jgi:hypothetical protein
MLVCRRSPVLAEEPGKMMKVELLPETVLNHRVR